MKDESSSGPHSEGDGGGSSRGDPGEQSPLQARAEFLKNWSWDIVVRLNRGACERGRAQHGANRETHEQIAAEWEIQRKLEISLADLIHFLRRCHKAAPFLFFNGNTFAEIGRRSSDAFLAELPTSRRREAASAVAHYIAGVLDWDAMREIIDSLFESASFKPGDRVKTFRGSGRGTVVRILDDARVVWRSDSSASELIALPESLIREG